MEPASDVYALGVLLYRLLAGESPWTVESTTQMLTAHVYIEPAPMPRLGEVPPQVTDLVDQCLRKDPADRPSAAQVSATLARVAAPKPSAPRPPVVVPFPTRSRKRLLLGGAAAVVVVSVLLWLLLPSNAADNVEVPSAAPPSISGWSATGSAPDGPAATVSRPGAAVPGRTPGASVTPSAAGATPTSPGAVEPPPAATVQPSPTPTAAPVTPKQPPAGVVTFTSLGGTVEARCTAAGKAELVSWTPNDPYVVQRVKAGPALAAVIIFKNGASRIRMTVTCVAGIPTVVTLPL